MDAMHTCIWKHHYTSAGHLHPPFLAIMDEIQDGLRYVLQTKSKYVCLISGTGHAGKLGIQL